jgi:uncharacterized membrane protein
MTFAVLTALLALSAWAWERVPAEGLPVHFGLDGKPDRFGTRWEALLTMPAIAALAGLIFAAVPSIVPRREELAASWKFYYAVWTGILLVMSAGHVMIVLNALDPGQSRIEILLAALGLLFVLIGNYLGKTRPNWAAGVRTPWTLSSDHAWDKTHRLGGALFVMAGLAVVVGAFTLPPQWALFLLIGVIVGATAITIVASYFYWREDPARTR